DVDYVVGPAFGHVAADATGRLRMLARCRQLFHRSVEALAAVLVIMPRRFLAARNVVRIVTGGAAQRACTLLKTLRAPQPVRRADDLELIVVTATAVRGARCVIELEHEIPQRLPRPVGERTSPVPHD